MTNLRRYIEVTRTSIKGRLGELEQTLDIGERHAWFIKMEDGVLVLDHYVEQRRVGRGHYNGIAWWNRGGPEMSNIRGSYRAMASRVPDDVWAEAEAREAGIWEDTPDDPCWGAAP